MGFLIPCLPGQVFSGHGGIDVFNLQILILFQPDSGAALISPKGLEGPASLWALSAGIKHLLFAPSISI